MNRIFRVCPLKLSESGFIGFEDEQDLKTTVT
jgi:hypothetical protein